MTALLVLLDAALVGAAGATLAGLARTQLRLLERSLIAAVAGIIVSSAVVYGLALLAGLNAGTVLGGPAIVVLISLAIARFAGDPRRPWIDSWRDSVARWRGRGATLIAASFGIAVTSVVFALIFSHTVFESTNGGLEAGFTTVWADWSQHLSTAASFAAAGNLPPVNPLLSGNPLLYPFLPDFHAATLTALGLAPGPALAIPGALLAVLCVLLVVALAMRLQLKAAAGIVAAVICFIGGGLGFIGVFADACTNHGYSASQCTFQHVVTDPADALPVIGGTLREVPAVIAAQPRAYDGLQTDPGSKSLPNLQWYTPLLAWWLPQRTLLYGFSAAISAFILVLAGRGATRRDAWGAFALAGVLIGLLPLVHVQTLIAAGVIVLALLLAYPRLEWIALFAAAAVLGVPRLAQLVFGPHGSMDFGNSYPSVHPGWLANSGDESMPGGGFIEWGRFWFYNLGVAVPLSVIVSLAAMARFARGRIGDVARRLTSPFPAPLLWMFAGAMVIFAVCNIVVLQSWIWDNTKLFVYWYLVVGLLVGALVTAWWRRWWRATAAVIIAGSMVLTGFVVTLRLVPWTPADHAITGPYEFAGADERALATTIAASTPSGAVFLTPGRPNDPLLAIGGRTAVMGYFGWLWSYGIVFGTRYDDVRTMYRGCASEPATCPIPALLHRYHISFVEVDDRLESPGVLEPSADLVWWQSQGFPVVGRSAHIVVYDVRRVA